MAKNIALFIDGTGNDGTDPRKAHEQTNVYRLYSLCTEKHKLYLPGVGSRSGDVLGGAIGFGTRKRLILAYNFLVSKYQPGDSIYMFGFSRGALAVRLLADFLGYAGSIFLKHPFNKYLPHVYRIYEGSVILDVVGQFQDYLRDFHPEVPPIPVHFIGVWDTVERYLPKRTLPHIAKLASHIDHARQALAIHERRNEMTPRLWTEWIDRRGKTGEALPTVQQVWFPGAHADVGGGYKEFELSESPLAWILSEAVALKLKVRQPIQYAKTYVMHQQRTSNTLVGLVNKSVLGEDTRKDLSTENSRILSTMDFNGIAEDYLNGKSRIGEMQLRKFPPFSRNSVESHIKAVDKAALRLLKIVRKKKNKKSIP